MQLQQVHLKKQQCPLKLPELPMGNLLRMDKRSSMSMLAEVKPLQPSQLNASNMTPQGLASCPLMSASLQDFPPLSTCAGGRPNKRW